MVCCKDSYNKEIVQSIRLPMSALAFCSPQTTALWAACVKGIFDISSFM